MASKKNQSTKSSESVKVSAPAVGMSLAEDFEKLGVFYLGRPYDLVAKQPKPGWLLYDSKDLVTRSFESYSNQPGFGCLATKS